MNNPMSRNTCNCWRILLLVAVRKDRLCGVAQIAILAR
jgi:hypothetical protein